MVESYVGAPLALVTPPPRKAGRDADVAHRYGVKDEHA